MRHQAEDVAGVVENAGDAPRRAVDLVEVAKGDAPVALEAVECGFVGLKVAVVVRDREGYLLAGVIISGEQALAVLYPERHLAANELERRVAHQRAGEKSGLG